MNNISEKKYDEITNKYLACIFQRTNHFHKNKVIYISLASLQEYKFVYSQVLYF